MNKAFEKLHHVCNVVHDIDKTQACYESIGIGPWIAYPPLVEYEELEVPDADAAEAGTGLPVKMRRRRANRTGFTYYNTEGGAGVVLLTRATNNPGT